MNLLRARNAIAPAAARSMAPIAVAKPIPPSPSRSRYRCHSRLVVRPSSARRRNLERRVGRPEGIPTRRTTYTRHSGRGRRETGDPSGAVLRRAGDLPRAVGILRRLVATLPAGRARAGALALLGFIIQDEETLLRAVDEVDDDTGALSVVHTDLATIRLSGRPGADAEGAAFADQQSEYLARRRAAQRRPVRRRARRARRLLPAWACPRARLSRTTTHVPRRARVSGGQLGPRFGVKRENRGGAPLARLSQAWRSLQDRAGDVRSEAARPVNRRRRADPAPAAVGGKGVSDLPKDDGPPIPAPGRRVGA
jgi:hypothetical protein